MAFKAGAIYGEATLDTKKWSGGLKSMAKGVGIAMAAVGAAVIAAMTKAVQAADEFQRAMSNVSTVVDTTAISTQDLTLQLLRLDPALGDVTELTNALYQSFSAGAETAEEAVQTTVDAAKFAKAGLTETATAVDVLTTAVNAYGRETVSTTEASDIFFTTIKAGKITGDELAQSIGDSIPLFASSGIALEELAAGMAAMTKQGVNAANSTTQLNAIVNAFLKPSESMNELIKKMGFESGAAFLKAEGLAGALKLIEDNTKGDAAEMSKLLPNVRALRGAMALTGVGGETFNQTLEDMGDAAGATQVAFDKQEKTFDTFKNSAKNLQVVVGNIGKHFVDQLAGGAIKATQGILAFITSSQGMNIVAKVAGFASGGFNALRTAMSPIFENLKGAWSGVFEALRENLGKIFDRSKEGAGGINLMGNASAFLASGMKVAGTVIKSVIDLIGDMVVAMRESAETIGTFFQFLTGKKKWEDVKQQAQEAGGAFKNLGQNFVGNIKEVFNTVVDEVETFKDRANKTGEEVATSYKINFKDASDNIKVNWAEMLTGQEDFTGDLENSLAGILDSVETINDDLIEDNQNARDKWLEHWEELVSEGTKTYEEMTMILDTALADQLVSQEQYNELSGLLWEENFTNNLERINLYANSVMTAYQTLTDSVFAIQQQKMTNDLALLDLSTQAELEDLQERFEAEKITQEEYEAEKKEIEENALKERNTIEAKAFKAEKANRISGILMDTASAIQGFWASAAALGPVAGPIFAAAMTAIVGTSSIAQIALIAAQKFVPSKQMGGEAGGMTRVNERGGELINLPDGSVVIPNDISKQIAGATDPGQQVVNVSFEGAKIGDEMDLEHVTDVVARKLGEQMRLVG